VEFGVEKRGDPLISLAFSPDSRVLAVAGGDGAVKLWEVGRKKGPYKMLAKVPGGFLAYSPDGKRLAATDDDVVRVWDVPAGKASGTLQGHQRVRNVAFSPDGKTLATCGAPATVHLWDLRGRTVRATLAGHSGYSVVAVAFSPDGNLLATGGSDRSVRLWDGASTKEKAALKGHTAKVFDLAFSPDGKSLASAGLDRTVRLWDLQAGKERAILRGHKAGVYSVSFSPDGKALVSASGDSGRFGEILLWDLVGLPPGKRPAGRLTRGKLRSLWRDLCGPDASRFFLAHRVLLAAPAESLPWLRLHLKPERDIDERRLARLIKGLDVDSFGERQKAEEEIGRLGEMAEPALRQALAGKPPLEQHRRIERLLGKLSGSPRYLLAVRVTELLERLGPAEAGKLLRELGAGAQQAWLTREAKASLRHLERQKATRSRY
jgi:WD40 repeat protein